jgi:chromosome partitioning protein
MFFEIGKKKRLSRLLEGLAREYDRIILDCPPGLTETSEQVLQAADIVIAPVIPSPLSRRALGELARFLVKKGGKHPPMLPVFSMVDRRRSLHLKSLEEEPSWPVVPMASAIEQMAVRRAPLGTFAPNSPSAAGFNNIWSAVEKRLCR